MTPNSVTRITSEYFTYEVLRNIAGVYVADQWKAYHNSADKLLYEKQARKLNRRGFINGIFMPRQLSIDDKRTVGGKFLVASRANWQRHYEQVNPPPKEPQGSNAMLARIMKVKAI